MKFYQAVVVVVGLVLASLVFTARAAAPVAEIGAVLPQPGTGVPIAPTISLQASPAASPQVDAYYLMQSLRDELRLLRGMLEEQGNEIRQLKQRQVDDYLDLDRRVSGLAVGSVSAPGSTPVTPTAATKKNLNPVFNQPTDLSDSDKGAYEKAYGELKSGKVEAAKIAFKSYLTGYPKGRYVANTQYWLGEIYMLDNQLKEASEAFAIVVQQYPAHRKVLDASFKLGKVYHLQGQTTKAKALLSRVASTSGSAGKLAGDYLSTHF